MRALENKLALAVLFLIILSFIGGGCMDICPSDYYVASKWTPDGWVVKREFISGADENIYFVAESPPYGIEALVIFPEQTGGREIHIPKSRFMYSEDCCPPSEESKYLAAYLHTRCSPRVDCCWVEDKVKSFAPGSYLVWWQYRRFDDTSSRSTAISRFYVK